MLSNLFSFARQEKCVFMKRFLVATAHFLINCETLEVQTKFGYTECSPYVRAIVHDHGLRVDIRQYRQYLEIITADQKITEKPFISSHLGSGSPTNVPCRACPGCLLQHLHTLEVADSELHAPRTFIRVSGSEVCATPARYRR